MNNEKVVAKVNDVMRRGFEIPADKLIPSATLFEDLGLDSLDVVDMLVHLEENIGVKVDGEQIMKVRTLQDIYTLVENLAAEPGAHIKLDI